MTQPATHETPPPIRYDTYGRRLCTAHRTDGADCNAPALNGMNVCRVHGGSTPQAKRKAALRLVELIDPAIGTLAREMVQAEKSADRQRAANSILDRAGVARRTEVSHEDSRDLVMAKFAEWQAARQQELDNLTVIEEVDE